MVDARYQVISPKNEFGPPASNNQLRNLKIPPYLASLDPSGEVHRAVRSPGVERRTGGIFRLTRAYHLSDPWPWHLAVIGKVLLNGLLNIANRWILAKSPIKTSQK